MGRSKNVIPTVFLVIVCWIGLGYLVYATSPNMPLPLFIPIDSKIAFFLLLFFALFLSFSLLFHNSRRGFLVAVGLSGLALLAFFHLFHPLYIILLVALLLTIEIYFRKE